MRTGRCKVCGLTEVQSRSLGKDGVCVRCRLHAKAGKPERTYTHRAEYCDCGNLAIVETWVYILPTHCSTPVPYLMPLCFPCWKLEQEMNAVSDTGKGKTQPYRR